MGANILHMGAVLQCGHAGPAQPTTTESRVKVSGAPVVTQSSLYSITGCSLSGSGSPPCVTANFVSAATRVKANGQPVLLANSSSVCVPTGSSLSVISSQSRVKGV